MRTNRVLLLITFATGVFILSVLTVLFWSFMTDKIFVPIYYFFWVGSLIINSIPQSIFLVLLVILSMVISLKTLGNFPANRSHHTGTYDQPNSASRYQHWHVLAACAHGTWFSKNRLAAEARELILSMLASEQGIDRMEAEEMVRNGELDLPAMLRDVIILNHIPDTPPKRVPRIRFWLRWRDTSANHTIDQFLTELINFVEQHLEITSHAGNETEL